MVPDTGKPTLGIITALPIEYAAMQALIDAPRPVTIPDDRNYYVHGSLPSSDPLSPHRVVLTMLARDGTRSAAATCADLLRSFPSIRVVIVGGIAGGVPTRGVRLGDVVVAEEIIDVTHTRRVDGHDEIRRRVDGLSIELIRAARHLQAADTGDPPQWATLLADGTNPALARFARPSPGVPQIHCGAVASGDQLLRDATTRDTLAARFGVLAVEMETTGVAAAATARGVQWFVARGISDNCDAEKNDRWHPFAALAAAAYARALLGSTRPLSTANGGPIGDPGEPFHRPSWAQIMTMVELALDVPMLAEERGRQAVIDRLRPAIRGAVRRHSSARLDLAEMLSSCFNFDGGTEEFVAALLGVEGGSRPAQRLSEALSAGVRPAG
jgi:nucleoside phosphorylase